MLKSLKDLYVKFDWCDLLLNEYVKYEKEILDMFNNGNIEPYKQNEKLYI